MTSSAERTGRCKSGDVEIFYRLFGDAGATPLLILHGLSYFSYDWRDIAAALATGRQVAAMDMRARPRRGGTGPRGVSGRRDARLPGVRP